MGLLPNAGFYGVPVATDEKFGRMKELMDVGKEKGFVLYDEMSEVLAEGFPTGREFDDLLSDLDSAGVEILDEPKLDFEKKVDEGEDLADLELTAEGGDKTNDPVRMYLREMGTVPLLTREGEVEIARRIERGQLRVLKALSRSPIVIREIIAIGEDLKRGVRSIKEVVLFDEEEITEEVVLNRLKDKIGRAHV